MPPKRIVIVASVPTHPDRAGNTSRLQRITSDLKRLGHEVHYIFIDDTPADLDSMRVALDGRLHVVSNPRPPFENPWRFRLMDWCLRPFGRGINAQILSDADAFISDSLRERVAELAKEIEPDVAIVAYPFYAGLLRQFSADTTKILDTLDEFSGRHWSYWTHGFESRFVSMTERAEIQALEEADLLLAIQDEELEAFSQKSQTPGITVRHRVELKRVPLADASTSPRIGYVSGDSPANRSRLRWFIARVLPRLRDRYPDLELHIAGSVGDAPDIPAAEGVRLLGRVDDLAKFFEDIHVFVNPASAGTGLHIKNIEAMASAVPIVMHPVAMRGIREGQGNAFRVATTPRDFEREISRLIDDRAAALELSDGAYRFAEKNDAWVLDQLQRAVAFR